MVGRGKGVGGGARPVSLRAYQLVEPRVRVVCKVMCRVSVDSVCQCVCVCVVWCVCVCVCGEC